MKMRNKTLKGLVGKIYEKQKRNSNKRKQPLPEYTLIQLRAWVYNQPNFFELYHVWVESGYDVDLVPSIDRVKPKLGYILSNLQVMTWADNNAKGYTERPTTPVKQYTKLGQFVAEFSSATEAANFIGVTRKAINNACLGKSKTSGGFLWKY